jgi:hypothetical protein
MLNWHYLWFREGKGLTSDKYARMVTALILEGADDADAEKHGDSHFQALVLFGSGGMLLQRLGHGIRAFR